MYDIGFLGGGQLARMSIMAAQRMGYRCLSLDPSPLSPASQIADTIVCPLDSVEGISQMAQSCQRVTLENEFLPVEAIRAGFSLAGVPETVLLPGLATLEVIQDKLRQREALAAAGLPVPRARAIEGDVDEILADLGLPLVLKSRFGGYDGKGVRIARSKDDLLAHRADWEHGGWLAEQYVPFTRELAAIVYRSEQAEGAFPTQETIQTNAVCDLTFSAGRDASGTAIEAVQAIGGLGLFGVELFELTNGEVWVNEIAPRPHNTGHYTLDWSGISQFEQLIRLVMGLPTIEPRGSDCCMANLLGQSNSDDFRAGIRAAILAEPQARVHWYGKAESRLGRKMGHINVCGSECQERAQRARNAFYRACSG